MSELDQVLAAVDKFESDLGFTAPELIGMRIGQLREMVRDAFEGDDDWFEVGDADAGTLPAEPQPAPELAAAMAETRERLDVIEERIGNLAAGLKLSASASQPSKKSEIEMSVHRALLALLDPR